MMMYRSGLFQCIIVCMLMCGSSSHAGRVLLVCSQITSHMIEQAAVAEKLLENGHEVYAVFSTSFTKGPSLLPAGVKPIFYDSDEELESVDDTLLSVFSRDPWTAMMDVSETVNTHCRAAVEDRKFMEQIASLDFDIALADGFVLTYCNLLLPYLHRIPFASMFSNMHPWMVGAPALPSVYPFAGIMMAGDRMSFVERVINLYWYVIFYKMTPFPGINDRTLLQEHAPDVPTWEVLSEKADLFISTRDHILHWPSPSMPNFLQTPGITTKPAKPLPQELEGIIEAANKEVIIVSFGSLASRFPDDITDKLLDAFNQLADYTVIWKFSGKSLEYMQSKVKPHIHLVTWFPQNDLLGHNRTVAFVTHCGNNGQYEAVYHGVPMVGLPIYGDQPQNALRIQDHGYGLSFLPDGLYQFTTSELVEYIKEVINNPKYKVAVQKASNILQDNAMTPAESIAYWLEHVMKHGGEHLRSHGMDMPWYQFFMLDILACLLLLAAIVLYIGWKVARKILCCCFNASKQKQE